jgi:hypothetical protein
MKMLEVGNYIMHYYGGSPSRRTQIKRVTKTLAIDEHGIKYAREVINGEITPKSVEPFSMWSHNIQTLENLSTLTRATKSRALILEIKNGIEEIPLEKLKRICEIIGEDDER